MECVSWGYVAYHFLVLILVSWATSEREGTDLLLSGNVAAGWLKYKIILSKVLVFLGHCIGGRMVCTRLVVGGVRGFRMLVFLWPIIDPLILLRILGQTR